ncbi:hypothetical protein A9P82_04325 [Arachidicoccus ginsenosidimutans]|uniref:glycosyl hydrolase family 95 catalytic domain-containing protein n=1 Tax=Arachidicoccus sp. BS20 TaxID=1850526 RepID=UPI0007F0CC5C|nr:hypothetical protein [Arachidicoccus sp. BS20]ANI90611.1 hypothetical protein A9P82_04325 [Arachidicoccus sp. BS20]
MQKHFSFIFFLFLFLQANAQNIDWQKFLSRNDMSFDTLTTKWGEGVFTGNGLLGDMIYMKDTNSLRIEIGRTDVADHRNDTTVSELYTKARLPIGYFLLKPVGKIIKNTARLNLWNAEATGVVETDKGKIFWRSLSVAKENVVIFQTKTEGDENNFSWDWVAEKSISPRFSFHPIKNFPANPENKTGKQNSINYSLQPMLAGGDYTTAWETFSDNQNAKTTFITVAYDTSHSSLQQAVSAVNTASHKDFGKIISAHQAWWHQYYQKSFLSLPDAKAESFYWIQLYKIASATRSNTLPIDLMGPWFAPTPWPAYWNNLNTELTYSPMFNSNHLEMVEPFIKNIDKNFQHLINNAPQQYRYNAAAIARSSSLDMISPLKVFKEYDSTASPSELELGDLTWLLYYYWQYYSYSKDETIAQNLLPVLKRSVNYFIDVMHKEADGKYHLPKTYSPEYPDGITRDCNYALSLFRWGCETLLNIAPNDSLANTWKDVMQSLTPYPADSTGLRIGRDVAFAQSHRHYSHLLMIYPLHLLNWDNENERSLIAKSLEHWHSLKGAFQGYSFTGGASIYATMGKGDEALNYLNELFSRYVKPNTLYLESGPVIETPLAAATSLQELLLQSRNGKIRVFPAVPMSWQNVSFENMRTDGAFLISAVRKSGKTKWLKIESLAGGKCTFVTDMKGNLQTKSKQAVTLAYKGYDTYQVGLRKGQTVIIYSNENDLKIPVEPVLQNDGQNSWGTKSASSKVSNNN